MAAALDWLGRGWRQYRSNPGRWAGAGIALLLAWIIPHVLTGIIPPIISGRGLELLDVIGPQPKPSQVVLTAFYWSCLLGVMTMAVREKLASTRRGMSGFISGFFGGFFLLPFAILWEIPQPEDIPSRLAMVAVTLPFWPLISLGLFLLAAQPVKEERRALFRQFWPRYLPLLCLEAICGLMLAAGWALGGLGLVVAGPLRLLALAEAFSDLNPQ